MVARDLAKFAFYGLLAGLDTLKEGKCAPRCFGFQILAEGNDFVVLRRQLALQVRNQLVLRRDLYITSPAFDGIGVVGLRGVTRAFKPRIGTPISLCH